MRVSKRLQQFAASFTVARKQATWWSKLRETGQERLRRRLSTKPFAVLILLLYTLQTQSDIINSSALQKLGLSLWNQMLFGLLNVSVIVACFCHVTVLEGEVGRRPDCTQLLSCSDWAVSSATRLKLHLSLSMYSWDKQNMLKNHITATATLPHLILQRGSGWIPVSDILM